MTRFAHLSLSILAISALAWPLEAADGVLIVEKTTTGGKTETHQIQIEKDRVRAETTGQMGQKPVFVFDGSKQLMWLIDSVTKTYNDMTPEQYAGAANWAIVGSSISIVALGLAGGLPAGALVVALTGGGAALGGEVLGGTAVGEAEALAERYGGRALCRAMLR